MDILFFNVGLYSARRYYSLSPKAASELNFTAFGFREKTTKPDGAKQWK